MNNLIILLIRLLSLLGIIYHKKTFIIQKLVKLCTTYFIISFFSLNAQILKVPVIMQAHPVTCMIASSTSVMQYFGKAISYSDFSSKVYISAKGITFYDLQQWLYAYGFQTTVCSLKTSYIPILLSLGIPPIVAFDNKPKHVVVVSGFNTKDSVFIIMDPLKGENNISWQQISEQQSKAAWQGMLIIPDTLRWKEKIANAGLPLSNWLQQNRQYRSEALLLKAQQTTKIEKKMILLACSCETEPKNIEACTQYAAMLLKQGMRDEAYNILRKILLYNPNYINAKQLKEELDKGK